MLAALNPLAGQTSDGRADLAAAAHRIAELERKLQTLERDKRRAERLLWLTRKSFKAPLTPGRRGPWPGRRRVQRAAMPTSLGASSHDTGSAH
jgi:hypothetical protein